MTSGHSAPYPQRGCIQKPAKTCLLSEREFVIRHIRVQVQPPTSCWPCPFCAYGREVKHERFHPAGWCECCKHRGYASDEIREEIHADGRQYHEYGVLVHEWAGQMFPAEIVVEPGKVTLSRPTFVVRLNDTLLVTGPVIWCSGAEKGSDLHVRLLCMT